MQPITALLVIDMQLCAFDGQITSPICQGDELLVTVAELISSCRRQGLPIIFIQTCAISGQPYSKDSHGWEIHANLGKKSDDKVVYKVLSNAFEDTDLQDVLSALRVSSLITCGIWSEYCVANTSLAALSLAYEVYVVADAHGTVAGSDTEAMHTVATQNKMLASKGAHVARMSELSLLLDGR
jgi:nicotinamidase-related amidase